MQIKFQDMFKALNPEEVPAQFVEAWKNRDADALASIFVEDGDFINVTGLWWNNRPDIREAHHFGFTKIFMDSNLELLRTKVRYLASDIAIVHARMDLESQTNRAGNIIKHKRHTLFTFVVKQEGGEWKAYAAQNSEILTGAQTFERQEDGSYKAVRYGNSKIDYSKYERIKD